MKNYPVKHLQGDILHYSYYTISEHIAQNNKFSTMAAESLFEKGKRTTLLNIIVHPFWAFFTKLSYPCRIPGRIIRFRDCCSDLPSDFPQTP